MEEFHEEILKMETLHGVEFDYEAILLAARIVRHHKNPTLGGEGERFFYVLNKACEFKDQTNNDNQKELNKYAYFLQRLNTKNYFENDNMRSLYRHQCSWLEHVVKEVKEEFVDLMTFMKTRMQITHHYFVSSIHEAQRIQDCYQILEQIDSKTHYRFREKLNNIIGVNEVAEIASKLTGIPASWFVIPSPEERFLKLKQGLCKRVTGERDAIESIINALLKPKAESSCSARALGLFLFVGPDSVGKSELAKAIASELYDDERRLIRIDMEKYMEPDSVSCLVGSLTETAKNKPYSVLLLDKIDKVHSSVMDSLVSVLNPEAESRNQIDFENTLIIMTCDVEDGEMYELMLASVMGREYEEATTFVKPELLELLDRMITLTAIEFRRTNERNIGATVCPSESALEEIASNAAKEHGEIGERLKR